VTDVRAANRIPFALTSALLVLFAAGHTYGFLALRPPSAQGLAVLSSMHTVTFTLGHTAHTYWDFYLGFGLFVSAYLLLAAVVAWELPHVREASREAYVVLAFALFAAQALETLLASLYFRGPPMLLSLVLLACLVWGIIASASERRHVPRPSPSTPE
jgi:hypothetical protein